MRTTATLPEALPLPKGGGATRGLGDGFTPDFNRGTGGYAIGIEVPIGYRNLTPDLKLVYNTAAGDGPFGFGWNLGQPAIQIDSDIGVADYLAPQFLLGGETLAEMGDGTFHPLVENAFARIRRLPIGWEVTDKGGTLTIYGPSPQSQVFDAASTDPGAPDRIFAWLPETVRDTSGNEIHFTYLRDGNALYLERVDYAVFQVKLSYEPRHDVSISRRAGFAVTRRLRCSTIEILRPADASPLIRRYMLTYGPDRDAPTLLAQVQIIGFKRQPDGTIESTTGPALKLTYSAFEPAQRRYRVIGDKSGDFPGPLGVQDRELVDLHGSGLPDVVQLGPGPPLVWQNLGAGEFAPARLIANFPTDFSLATGTMAFLDVAGSGAADLVLFQPGDAYYYPNLGDGSFDRPRFLGASTPLSVDLADPNTRLADVDGDGRVDLLQTTETALLFWQNRGGTAGFEPPTVIDRKSDRDVSPDLMLSEPGVLLADMTGDGLPDLVHIVSGLVEYWPSLGSGSYDRRVVMESPPVLPRHYEASRLFVADIDGSGPSDVIYVDSDRLVFWRNIGGVRFSPPVEVTGVPLSSADSVQLVDLLGRGMAGILWSGTEDVHEPGYRFLSFADTKPFLLTMIDNGVGLQTRLEYGTSSEHAARDARAGAPWPTRLPMPVHVVNRISHHDLVTGLQDSMHILYHDGRWDPESRRFRGFGRVTARRSGDAASPDTWEEHQYLVGAPGEPALGPSDDFDRARRGQVFQSTFFSAGLDSPATRVETTVWQIATIAAGRDGSSILFPQVASTVVYNIEGSTHPRVMTASYKYDPYGNVIEERRLGSAPAGDDEGNPLPDIEVITRVEFAINPSAYVVDHVARAVTLDGAGNIWSEVRHYYDGPALEGLPLGQVTAGLLARQEELVLLRSEADSMYGAGVDWAALGYHETTRLDGKLTLAINHTRLTQTAHGLPAMRVDALGSKFKLTYDTDGLLVVGTDNELGHTMTAIYDTSWQLIEQSTDENGAATRYAYDGLGRLKKIIRPGDSEHFPSVTYVRTDTALPLALRVQQRRTAGTPDVYEKAIFFDGLGRSIQERNRLDSERVRVSGALVFSSKGEPISKGLSLLRTGLDFEPPETLPATPVFRYGYDSQGRVLRAANLDGREVSHFYTPWAAIYQETDSGTTTARRIEHFDCFGRPVGVTLLGTANERHRASYTYDLLGRLIASTDLEGRPALLSASYDGSGARLRFTHAACGTRTSLFDARGRVVRYSDDRNLPVERRFDALNRLVSESVQGEVQETYTYDLPGQIGRLSRVQDNAGIVTFQYDPLGRMTEKLRQIRGQTYRLAYSYDAAGMQKSLVYPDGTAVDFTRFGDGRIRSLSGFVDEVSYDAQGIITEIRHANGVSEAFAYNVSSQVTDMVVTRGADTLRHARLTRDAAGRITQNAELAGPFQATETYEFDPLSRLAAFTTDRSGAPVTSVYASDADGNLLRADEMASARFEYDFTAPGALKRRQRSNGTVDEFAFDSAGHITSLDGMQLAFDARGRLLHVAKADGTIVEMTYDYRGARAAKTVSHSPSGNYEVRYVDDLYEDRPMAGTAYVYFGGRLVGQRRGGGTRHLHTDHRASVVLVTKGNGQIDGRAWFGPFGGGQPLSEDDLSREFVSAVLDHEIGLYYFNHRFYSPSLGRFISPDPLYLAAPERKLNVPQLHNLYTYARGDPINYVDPTGLDFSDFISGVGKVVAGVVVAAAAVVAIAVMTSVIAAGLGAALIGAGVGALIGGLSTNSWTGAGWGAMLGSTAALNGPLGIVNALAFVKDVRNKDWYKGVAGWSSWFMPASWPGHILGLGVFLGNIIAHVFGSDRRIESMKFDFKHGQIMTAGGEYGGAVFPWLGMDSNSINAHSVGGFMFIKNEAWSAGGNSWSGVNAAGGPGAPGILEHETGHMLSNSVFGFWQGIVQAIEVGIFKTGQGSRFFERVAESNVDPSERSPGDYGYQEPFWESERPPACPIPTPPSAFGKTSCP